MKTAWLTILPSTLLLCCGESAKHAYSQEGSAPFIVVLGIAQDAGLPQAGCRRACCAAAWREPSLRRNVSSLALVDPVSRERWLIDATPDLPEQLRLLDEVVPATDTSKLAGIFLTHGHIGHYTGLMHFGREAMGAKGLPVYAMPRMRSFLSTNGPWDQLIRLQNIVLRSLECDSTMVLNARLQITPLLVPHRDEYTETVGFRIDGPRHSAVFIPDIDKWENWERRVEDELKSSTIAYLDGTFYGEGEIPGRNMAEIPHPFISETIIRLSTLAPSERNKVRFIHLNHTNPALQDSSAAFRGLRTAGFWVAVQGERFAL